MRQTEEKDELARSADEARGAGGAAEIEDDGFLPPVRGGDIPPADSDTGDNRGLRQREAGPSRSSRR